MGLKQCKTALWQYLLKAEARSTLQYLSAVWEDKSSRGGVQYNLLIDLIQNNLLRLGNLRPVRKSYLLLVVSERFIFLEIAQLRRQGLNMFNISTYFLKNLYAPLADRTSTSYYQLNVKQ